MRQLLTLAFTAAILMVSPLGAQQSTPTLQRVHLVTGVGTLPRNPRNRTHDRSRSTSAMNRSRVAARKTAWTGESGPIIRDTPVYASIIA